MKARAATVSVAGIAALAASVMLAGCGSGSKTASSSTASAASTAASSAASNTTTDTAHKVAVTLPEIPGWSDGPKTEIPGTDVLAAIKLGEDASISVGAQQLKKGEDPAQYARDAVTGDSTVGGGCKMGDPDPATMSGYSGFRSRCLGGQISQIRAAFGVPETADAPASWVFMTGLSANSFFDQLEEALNQIIEKGAIVP